MIVNDINMKFLVVGPPSIYHNPSFTLLGRSDIVSSASWQTSSFQHTHRRKESLVSLFLPSLNWTMNLLSTATYWTHPTTNYFLILLILPSLVFSSISQTFAFTMDPILIFVLICFFSFISFIVLITGKLMVDLGEGYYWFQYRLATITLNCFLLAKK